MLKPEYDRTVFETLFERIADGTLTRAQAAEQAARETGCSTHTFLGWLRSSGKAALLKDKRLSAGANHRDSHAKNRPEVEQAYQEAIAQALAGRKSVRQVALAFAGRGVSYPWLLERVKKAQATPTTSAVQPAHPDNGHGEAENTVETAV